MNKFLLGLTGLILIILTVITINYYQDSRQLLHPLLTQPINDQENLETENEQPQPEQLQAIDFDSSISYSLQNNELNLTFNQGNDWTKVPIEKDQLFSGEYNGNKQRLIENSFLLTEALVGFLYSDGIDWEDESIMYMYSTDQGQSWKQSVVKEPFVGLRFRKVDFLNDNFGYIIISGYRTMSAEGSWVFLTDDGGASWQETENTEVTRLIYDGGFIDERTGFLSFGTINPDEPDVYLTEDGGHSWNQAIFNIPNEYQNIFVSAEVPTKETDHLSVLVNQGPNGDYQGGKVKGKFISSDNGKTWSFQKEVKPND